MTKSAAATSAAIGDRRSCSRSVSISPLFVTSFNTDLDSWGLEVKAFQAPGKMRALKVIL